MSTSRTDPSFERARAFERAACVQIARRTEQLPYGLACFDESLPFVYVANCVWVPGPVQVDVATLVADCDRLFAPFEHRWVTVEHEPLWSALEEDFGAAGWGRETLVWMIHRGGARVLDEAHAAREVARGDILDAEERFAASRPWGSRAGVRSQVASHHALLGDVLGERYFAAYAGGEVVAYAKLRVRDDVAQVEDVAVLAAHRGAGLGRLVAGAATQAGLELDPELLFIVADDDDWPKELYARLGYVPAGRTRVYHRLAPGESL